MVEAAREKDVVHTVNLHNRFYPAAYQLRGMVWRGKLGKVLMVHGGYLQDCFLYDTDINWRMLAKDSGSTRVLSEIGVDGVGENGIRIICLTPYNPYFNSLDEDLRRREITVYEFKDALKAFEDGRMGRVIKAVIRF